MGGAREGARELGHHSLMAQWISPRAVGSTPRVQTRQDGGGGWWVVRSTAMMAVAVSIGRRACCLDRHGLLCGQLVVCRWG